jgi:site-specific recombinase XerD
VQANAIRSRQHESGQPVSRRPRKLDADLLDSQEVERLVAQCSRRAPTGLRNRALLVLGYRAGLRCQEALDLMVKDIDFDRSVITVRNGKGGRLRRVGMDAGTAAVVQRWLEARAKLHVSRSAPLLCTLRGEPMESSYVRHLMKRLARKAGLEKRAHYHGLRHHMACSLIREGAPLTTVQALLGHSSAATTSIYLSRLGSDEAVEFARERRWEPSR